MADLVEALQSLERAAELFSASDDRGALAVGACCLHLAGVCRSGAWAEDAALDTLRAIGPLAERNLERLEREPS